MTIHEGDAVYLRRQSNDRIIDEIDHLANKTEKPDWVEAVQAEAVRRKLVYFGKVAGYGIALKQHGRDSFSVLYGKQIDGPGLKYADAAAKLGQAFMHALACEGKIDNRERA